MNHILSLLITVLSVILPFQANATALGKAIDLFETGQYQQAFELLEPLSAQGNGMADYYIGLMYDPVFNQEPYNFPAEYFRNDLESNGKRFFKRLNTNAINYYKKAADAGIAYAQFRLGEFYEAHLGSNEYPRLSQKYKRNARIALKGASEKGNWRALYMFAMAQKTGSRTRYFAKDAFDAMEKSAKQGDRMAQFYLGKSLFLDLCERKTCGDISKAFAWFYVSGTQGSYHAKMHLKHLMPHMDEEELAKGKLLAATFLKQYIRQPVSESD